MVPDLGGCNAGLFSLCEEWKGRDCNTTRYAVNFSLSKSSCILPGDHGDLFLTMTARAVSLGNHTVIAAA